MTGEHAFEIPACGGTHSKTLIADENIITFRTPGTSLLLHRSHEEISSRGLLRDELGQVVCCNYIFQRFTNYNNS